MNEPRYVRARTVDHAIEALAEADGDGLIVAGGIVVGTLFNQRLASPSVLVDINRIDSMRHIARGPDGLTIGALATHDDILRSPDVKAVAPLLSEIAQDISCPRLRNRGTLGGSLCTIGGQGDPATGLIALGARMHLKSRSGPRVVALEDFYKNAFEVDLAPDEIVESVAVPAMQPGARFAFCKLGPRNAMDFTQITVAIAFVSKDGTTGDVRIGMNGVANTPVRPRATEKQIGESKPGSINWAGVAATLNAEISPQGDLVYSEDFKKHLAVVALQRAFEGAVARTASIGGQL